MNTPTPKTDARWDRLWRSGQSWYQIAEEMKLDCCQSERELTAAREELDEKEDCIDNWMEEAMRFKKQRDRLVEALKIITTFDYADLQCDNGHGPRYVATEALQSINQDHFPDVGNMIGTTTTSP